MTQFAFWGPPQPRRRAGRPSRRAVFDRALGILSTYRDAHGGRPDVVTQVRNSDRRDHRRRHPELYPKMRVIEPSMCILMGDENWKLMDHIGKAAWAIYWAGQSWAKSETAKRNCDIHDAYSVMGDLESWFIPDSIIRGWKATREAKELVTAGLWVRVQGGYRYVLL